MVTGLRAATVPRELPQPLFNRINTLSKSSSQAHWYMKRVEEYLRATPRRPVAAHSGEEVNRWLAAPGRKNRLSDWQFRQCVEAVGMLMQG